MKRWSILGPVEARWFSGTIGTRTGCYQWGGGSGVSISRSELHTGRAGTDRGLGLGGLFALGPSDSLDGAQGSVEPGLLGGLDLIEGQTQVVLQVLQGEEEPSHGLEQGCCRGLWVIVRTGPNLPEFYTLLPPAAVWSGPAPVPSPSAGSSNPPSLRPALPPRRPAPWSPGPARDLLC